MLQSELITKAYGDTQALRSVSLSLEEGHIFGLLGTNGAGKSTLLRILSGILKPDGGRALLDGTEIFENPEAKARIAYISDEPAFLTGATILDMAKMQAAYYHAQDDALLAKLCGRFSLPMDKRIAGFSKGTQKRAQIVLALSRHPSVLLCDETFDGLDPVMREIFRRVIGETVLDEGITTILAGHGLQEMEDICDSVGFLHEGKLLTSGDLDEVLSGICRIQIAFGGEIPENLTEGLHPLRVQKQGRLCVLTLRDPAETAQGLLSRFEPLFCETLSVSLEEVFILEMEEQGYVR